MRKGACVIFQSLRKAPVSIEHLLVISRTDNEKFKIYKQGRYQKDEDAFLNDSLVLDDFNEVVALRNLLNDLIDCKEGEDEFDNKEITQADESWGGFDSKSYEQHKEEENYE